MWLIYALMGIGQSIFVIILLLKFKTERGLRRQRPAASSPRPGISVLIPIKGVLPSLRGNLESILDQDYPGPLEIIVGIKDPRDPAVAVVEALAREPRPRKDIEVKVIVGPVDFGLNPKNSNLARAYSAATHSWIYCSDADVRLDRSHLSYCMDATQADPEAFATSMTVNQNSRNLGAMLEAVGSNLEVPTFFLATALKKDRFDAMSGASMFFHRELLKRAGGFEMTVNALTDDLLFGRELARCGGKGRFVPSVVRENLFQQSFQAYRARMVRWILIVRCFRQDLFWIAPFFWFWQWLCVAGWVSGNQEFFALAGYVLLSRLFSSLVAQITLETPRKDWLKIWALPIYDCIAPSCWLQAVFESKVVWSGTSLEVQRDGSLVLKK